MDNFAESAVLIGSSDGLKASEQSLRNNDAQHSDKQRVRNAQSAVNRSGLTLAEQLALNRQIKDDMMNEKFSVKPSSTLTADEREYLNEVYEKERHLAELQRQH